MKSFFKKKYFLPLLILILVAFVLRFWHLTTLPFPPDGDEVAYGYYGWSLLHFGTDEYGNKFPLYFSSIGDFKYPGLAYLNIAPAALFALTDLTIRFWSAFSGVVLVPLIFLFTLSITKNKRASFFAALFAAVSPWSIIESRLGYENHISMTLTLAGIVFFFVWSKLLPPPYYKKSKLWPVLTVFFLVLSIWTQAAGKFFIPAFFIAILIHSFVNTSPFRDFRKQTIYLLILLTAIVGLSLSRPEYRGRADEDMWKGLTSDQTSQLEKTYHVAGISPIRIHPRLTWALHNKYSLSVIDFSRRYLNHFSPDYLFFAGEDNLQKIPDMGVLLFIEMLTLPIGAITLLSDKKRKLKLLVFVWLFLSPIPSALTSGGLKMNRTPLLIVPLAILSGYGLWTITNIFKGKLKYLVYIPLIAGFFWSVSYSLNQIFIQKPVDKPWYKQQVNTEITQKVLSIKDKYKAVVMGDDDYIFFLFYNKMSPKEFLANSDIVAPESGRWEPVKSIGNIYFKMPMKCPLSGKIEVLYVCEGEEVPQNSRVVDVIYYLDRVPAYSLIEYYPLSERPEALPELPQGLHYMVGVEKPDGNPDGIIPEESISFW